jgi:hypothetical protein
MADTRYDFLNRRLFQIHREQEAELAPGTLEDVSRFEPLEFYDRDKMLAISASGGVQKEINRLIQQVLAERDAHPAGSNTECIAMDRLTEFLSKLDLEDFRKVRIEGLIKEDAEQDNPRAKVNPERWDST